MTLDNFEQLFPANRLKNGLAYFRAGKVSIIQENKEGDWSANVTGSEEYEVDIILVRRKIVETSCSCLSHNDDIYCKHIAAVLYAIIEESKEVNDEEEESEEEIAEEKENEVPQEVLSMLDELKPDQLRIFLKIHMQRNKQLLESFDHMARYFLISKRADDLAQEMSGKIEAHATGATIEPQNLLAVFEIFQSYLNRAVNFQRKKDSRQALDFALAVAETVAFECEYMEDEEGTHRMIMGQALRIIDELLLQTTFEENILNLISDRAIAGAADPNVRLEDYEFHWFHLIAKHQLTGDNVEEIDEEIEKQLADYKSRGNQTQCARLLRIKADLLNKNGKKREALKIVEKTPEIATNKERVNPPPSKKNEEYAIEKQKLLSDLESARTDDNKEQYADLQKLLIELLINKSDVLDLRKWAEQFYQETGDAYYFEAMKGTYMNAEWEKVKSRFARPGIR